MSKFRRAIAVLAPLGPIFETMRKDRRAIPMMIGIHEDVLKITPENQRAKVKRALSLLSWSKRYLNALLEEDAIRYTRTMIPYEPVEPEHQAEAMKRLALKAMAPKTRPVGPGGREILKLGRVGS